MILTIGASFLVAGTTAWNYCHQHECWNSIQRPGVDFGDTKCEDLRPYTCRSNGCRWCKTDDCCDPVPDDWPNYVPAKCYDNGNVRLGMGNTYRNSGLGCAAVARILKAQGKDMCADGSIHKNRCRTFCEEEKCWPFINPEVPFPEERKNESFQLQRSGDIPCLDDVEKVYGSRWSKSPSRNDKKETMGCADYVLYMQSKAPDTGDHVMTKADYTKEAICNADGTSRNFKDQTKYNLQLQCYKQYCGKCGVGPNKCNCPNGTAWEGSFCTADGTTQCKTCKRQLYTYNEETKKRELATVSYFLNHDDNSDNWTCEEALWSDWYNEDKPTGKGDFETVYAHQHLRPCGGEVPLDIHCAPENDELVDSTETGQYLRSKCDLDSWKGMMCRNGDNGGKCLDYKVRYLCPPWSL